MAIPFVAIFLAFVGYGPDLGRGLYGTLLARQMGFSLEDYGRWGAIGLAISMALYYPFGWLADRIHPVRLTAISHGAAMVCSAVGFLVIHDKVTLVIMNYALGVAYVAVNAGQTPLLPAFLPKEEYGQFCSGFAITNAITTLTGSALVGLFVDYVHGDYRYAFLWNTVVGAVPLVALLLFWSQVNRYGGLRGYQAPLPAKRTEPVEPAPLSPGPGYSG